MGTNARTKPLAEENAVGSDTCRVRLPQPPYGFYPYIVYLLNPIIILVLMLNAPYGS